MIWKICKERAQASWAFPGNVVLETGENIDRGGPEGREGANTGPDYASDRRLTGLALTLVFRATAMMSVAMDMPMRLLGT